MDPNATAQAIQTAQQALQAAQHALQGVSQAAQAIQSAQEAAQAQNPGDSVANPMAVAMMLGPVLSHIAQPFADKIPPAWRPAALALGMGAVSAGIALAHGTPLPAAVSYGVGTMCAGKVYHVGRSLANAAALAKLSPPPAAPTVNVTVPAVDSSDPRP